MKIDKFQLDSRFKNWLEFDMTHLLSSVKIG